jgi:hypothetical protein
MIRKSVQRFSEKIMLNNEDYESRGDDQVGEGAVALFSVPLL